MYLDMFFSHCLDLFLRLLFNDGEDWRNQRRFVLKVLKDFGFGRKSLEGVLIEEADRMADFFRSDRPLSSGAGRATNFKLRDNENHTDNPVKYEKNLGFDVKME